MLMLPLRFELRLLGKAHLLLKMSLLFVHGLYLMCQMCNREGHKPLDYDRMKSRGGLG